MDFFNIFSDLIQQFLGMFTGLLGGGLPLPGLGGGADAGASIELPGTEA